MTTKEAEWKAIDNSRNGNRKVLGRCCARIDGQPHTHCVDGVRRNTGRMHTAELKQYIDMCAKENTIIPVRQWNTVPISLGTGGIVKKNNKK
jgi:hypothetical protein